MMKRRGIIVLGLVIGLPRLSMVTALHSVASFSRARRHVLQFQRVVRFPNSPPSDAIVKRGRDQRPKTPAQSRAMAAPPNQPGGELGKTNTKPTPGRRPPRGLSLKSSESPTYSEKKGYGHSRMRPKQIRQCRYSLCRP